MVSYSSTPFDASKFDQESNTIHQEIVKLYESATSFFDIEESFYDILKKYNEHYLVYYFFGNFYKENKRYDKSGDYLKIRLQTQFLF